MLIPQAVSDELQATGAPDPVRVWFGSKPSWVAVRPAVEIPTDLFRLDFGERAAIALAGSVGADLILLDERKAREAARERGLVVAGTLGVLDLAARQGLVNLTEAIDRLSKTNFRIAPNLLRNLRNSSTAR